MDITYIPMARGFVYVTAVVDWATRRVLSWSLWITMEVGFCLDAVEEALAKHGKPAIFNSDQGSQFTSVDFTGLLLGEGVAISMDGRGAWRDNVFVERLWRSVKYEEVYLCAYTAWPKPAPRWAAIWLSTMPSSRTRALTLAHRTTPTSTKCRCWRRHEIRRGPWAALRSGYALPPQCPGTAD